MAGAELNLFFSGITRILEELESGAVPVAKGTTDRFRSPLTEPDLPISVIRLSDGIRSRHSRA